MDLACGLFVSRRPLCLVAVFLAGLRNFRCGLIFLHIGYGSFRLNGGVTGDRLIPVGSGQYSGVKWALQYRARNIMAHYQLSREDRPDG